MCYNAVYFHPKKFLSEETPGGWNNFANAQQSCR